MAIHTIGNEHFEVKVDSYGAQLISMKSAITGLEYLWCADESVWGKTSPVLFPYIGRVRDSYVKVDENVYPMTKHGFARNSEFAVEEQTSYSLCLLLCDNSYTHSLFPFAFEFRVKFVLRGKTLDTIYSVRNKDEKIMHFALGGHTGFSTENGGGSLSDFKLVFPKEEHFVSQCVNLQKGLLSGDAEDLGTAKEIPLSKDTFIDRDTLVFKGISNKSVKLVSSRHKSTVTVDYVDFPNLAVWAMTGTERYVCIEPWIGHTDAINTRHTLSAKPGFIKLGSGKNFEASYQITIEE